MSYGGDVAAGMWIAGRLLSGGLSFCLCLLRGRICGCFSFAGIWVCLSEWSVVPFRICVVSGNIL